MFLYACHSASTASVPNIGICNSRFIKYRCNILTKPSEIRIKLQNCSYIKMYWKLPLRKKVAILSGGDELTQRWISYDTLKTGQGRVIKFQILL